MRTHHIVLTVSLIAVSLVAGEGRADMGLEPLDEPQAKLYEPGQDALIAWNGTEELLVLRTEVYGSHATRVLEVLPLPAEPVVSKGNAKAFDKVQDLIDARLQPRRPDAKAVGDLTGAIGDDEPPAGKVTQLKRLGAHDIAVAKVLDAPRFAAWVEKYLKDKKLPQLKLPEALLALITTYTKEGFGWFVLDVVQVGTRRAGREPVQYRFKTSKLFYPLRISRRAHGSTRAQLTTLTTRPLAFANQSVDAPGVYKRTKQPAARCREQLRPFAIRPRQVASIDAGIEKLLAPGKDGKTYVGRVHCIGRLALFEKDVAAALGEEPKPPPPRKARPSSKKGAVGEGTLSDPF
jgi:hypothetical protein